MTKRIEKDESKQTPDEGQFKDSQGNKLWQDGGQEWIRDWKEALRELDRILKDTGVEYFESRSAYPEIGKLYTERVFVLDLEEVKKLAEKFAYLNSSTTKIWFDGNEEGIEHLSLSAVKKDAIKRGREHEKVVKGSFKENCKGKDIREFIFSRILPQIKHPEHSIHIAGIAEFKEFIKRLNPEERKKLFEQLNEVPQDSDIAYLKKILLRELPLQNILFGLAKKMPEHKEILSSPDTVKLLQPWFEYSQKKHGNLDLVRREILAVDLRPYISLDEFKTAFFRYANQFREFEGFLLKKLREKADRGEKEIKIWSAGCSTGQETYSLAILLHKIFKKNPELGKFSDWKIEIVGTDKNLYALRYAQRGEYSKSELMKGEERLKAEGYSLDGYLESIPDTQNFRIVEEIKKPVRFEYLDLNSLQRERMQNFDVIFCRNVYSYFAEENIILERLLKDMSSSLRQGGLLCCSIEDSMGAPNLQDFYFLRGFAKLDWGIFEKIGEKVLEEEALEKQDEEVVRGGAEKNQQKTRSNEGKKLQRNGGERVEQKKEFPLSLLDLFRKTGQIWDTATEKYRDGLWWAHRQKINERIQEAIGLSHNKDKVLILGAGSNEPYLRKLAENFNEITLNNLDVDSLKRAKETLPEDLQNKVKLNVEDLSLVTIKLAREVENIVNTSSNIKEALRRTIDLIAKTEPQGRLSFSDEEFDLIISTMVISQFTPFIRSYIARAMNEKFGYGSFRIVNNNLIHDLDNSLSDLSERILKKHFEELFRILKPAEVICLSSDVEDLSGNSILPSGEIEKFLLPDMKIVNKKEWVWKECPDNQRWVQSVIAKKESSPRVLILDIFGILLQGPEEKEISGKIFGGIKQAFPEIDIKGILSQLQNGKNLESILSEEEIQQIQEIVKKNLFGAYKPSFEMGEMLKEAIQKGVKIYIFSDVGSLGFLGGFIKGILVETLNLFYPQAYFPRENLIISDELGYKKSQKQAWGEILKRIGVNPEEVVVIDDKLENIKAAKQAGISNSVRMSDGGRDNKISKIRQKAEELTEGAKTEREKSDKLCEFARDIPYLLDPFWARGPEEVLSQNEGMCVGKNWLLGEMHRELGFPVRYIVKEIRPEREFWNWIFWYYRNIRQQDFTIKLPPIQSHIVLEVYLDGRWEERDVTTDKFLKLGMELLGIKPEREVVSQEVYNSLNEWAKNRQESIYIIENREQVIKKLNEGIEWIRNLGKCLYYFDRRNLPLASRELVVNPEKYFPGIELSKGIFKERLSEEFRRLRMLKDAGIINSQMYKVLEEIEKRFFDKAIQRDISDKEIESTSSEVIRAFLEKDDPLKELKDKVTGEVLGMLNKIEDKISQQSDQLLAAVKVAIAANAIGFTRLMQANEKEKQERTNLESEINRVLNLPEEGLKDFDYSVLRSHLSRKRQNILYLLDNAGEIVGDLPFIKRLLQDGHKITLVTRAKPVSNDITREDVNRLIERGQIRGYFGDLLNRINVISSGSPMMGTDLRFATKEFIHTWRGADFIIAKGEGQWQTLYNQGLGRDIFFLIRVKNSQRIRGLDVQEGDYLLKYVPKIIGNGKIKEKKLLSALLLLMVLSGKFCSGQKGRSRLLIRKFWMGLFNRRGAGFDIRDEGIGHTGGFLNVNDAINHYAKSCAEKIVLGYVDSARRDGGGLETGKEVRVTLPRRASTLLTLLISEELRSIYKGDSVKIIDKRTIEGWGKSDSEEEIFKGYGGRYNLIQFIRRKDFNLRREENGGDIYDEEYMEIRDSSIFDGGKLSENIKAQLQKPSLSVWQVGVGGEREFARRGKWALILLSLSKDSGKDENISISDSPHAWYATKAEKEIEVYVPSEVTSLKNVIDRLSDEDYVDGSEDKSIGKEENFSRDGGNKDGLNKFRRHKISFKTQKSFEENLFSGILSFLTRLIFSNSFFGKRIISVLGINKTSQAVNRLIKIFRMVENVSVRLRIIHVLEVIGTDEAATILGELFNEYVSYREQIFESLIFIGKRRYKWCVDRIITYTLKNISANVGISEAVRELG
ncbi:MAG: hypothetical protein DRP68_04065 [Candidatus Omnitrophota bacterium]|nr:MAG: hypothetical protein DRP68_04065 [Candidatus Omnitrophota bacterium]